VEDFVRGAGASSVAVYIGWQYWPMTQVTPFFQPGDGPSIKKDVATRRGRRDVSHSGCDATKTRQTFGMNTMLPLQRTVSHRVEGSEYHFSGVQGAEESCG
jgi:hypothetical protein